MLGRRVASWPSFILTALNGRVEDDAESIRQPPMRAASGGARESFPEVAPGNEPTSVLIGRRR